MTAEEQRLEADRAGREAWRRWGPYLSERQWGTVREDYSPDGKAWQYFPHDQARSRAYRWGEDGIAGISDDKQRLCFALTLWNGADPILKERLFGLSTQEGNHGEDVKEVYFYLDNLPSHAYMKMLYKYPQRAFPYDDLVRENARRGRDRPEYELLDTGVFDEGRYFDVFVEYAKQGPDDLCIRVTAVNRGPAAAELHLLPTLWFRNDWSWTANRARPVIAVERADAATIALSARHADLDAYRLIAETPEEALFTENETNVARLFDGENPSPYVKDGFHAHVVDGRPGAVNPARTGSKAALWYQHKVSAGGTAQLRLRLSGEAAELPDAAAFDALFEQRRQEAEAFYRAITPGDLSDDMRAVQRQAFAGLLWSKQFYLYSVDRWLKGDPTEPPPPGQRLHGRNSNWLHFDAGDILSMPDKWEYPWFAAWDTAFQAVALALVDPDLAKQQLHLMLRDGYLHVNGQVPAYEWSFGDVNPPVLAWATRRVYQIEAKTHGREDRAFLEKMFQRLLINFTWWVNRKDAGGNNIFEGGFLGLDNIGAFDRSEGLPAGGLLEQADGTSWMAMYCLDMLAIALELAEQDADYADIATKFCGHFIRVGAALNRLGERDGGLWDAEAGYYFDVLRLPDGRSVPIRAETIAGLIPLFAVATIDQATLAKHPEIGARLDWFVAEHPELLQGIANLGHRGVDECARLALVDSAKLASLLDKAFDEERLLSPFGIRSLSRRHQAEPYAMLLDGQRFGIGYEPGESASGLFGGNSNWRGPVWFPLNFLVIEALLKHHAFHGDGLTCELPRGSGRRVTLAKAAAELTARLIALFLRDGNGRRPVHGDRPWFRDDPHWRDLPLFYEYFHGDNGLGLGASHQTGWTGLVAVLIHDYATLSR